MKPTATAASFVLPGALVALSIGAAQAEDRAPALLEVEASAFAPAELERQTGSAGLSGLAAALAALPPCTTTQSQISGTGTTATTTATTDGTGTVQQPNPVVISNTTTITRNVSRSRTISLRLGG